jgi:hypothetical protein
MLPITTIRKIMRECFGDADLSEIISIKPNSQLKWLNSVGKRLNQNSRVESGTWTDEDDGPHLSLYIKGVGRGRNPNEDFQLYFATSEGVSGLWIVDANRRRHGTTPNPKMPVVDVAQIDSLVEQIIARQNKEHLRDQRKQKVASLQQTGLTSRLKELGQTHNFSFAISESVREVRLSIRIRGRKRGFHFSFPKGKLKQVLDQVPDLIHTLENLQRLGVNFRSENKRWKAKQGDWIEPAASKSKP